MVNVSVKKKKIQFAVKTSKKKTNRIVFKSKALPGAQ